MTTCVKATPTARKQHVCEDCGRIIRSGEKYRRTAGLDGGTAWTYKECRHCSATLSLWYGEIVHDYEYAADDFAWWEPSSVTGLRAKVNFRRQWTRADGSLVEVPS